MLLAYEVDDLTWRVRKVTFHLKPFRASISVTAVMRRHRNPPWRITGVEWLIRRRKRIAYSGYVSALVPGWDVGAQIVCFVKGL